MFVRYPNMNPNPESSCATYNIVSDRLKVWFDRRLDTEEYAAIRKAGFVFWHGSKCFTRVWSPEAEDLISVTHAIAIEDDDDPDDTEARVERFSRYAERSESSAVGAQDRLLSGRANTERRQRHAAGTFEREADKAAYWQGRIEASIRHANFKENPGVIARRIKKIETDLRYWEASTSPRDRSVSTDGTVSVWVAGPGGRSGRWVNEAALPAQQAHAGRWVEHLRNRLLYEQAVLAATDSLQAKLAEPGGVQIEVGGAIKHRGRWHVVTKLNKVSVEYYDPACHWCPFQKADLTTITEIATKLRVDAGEILVAHPPVVEKVAIKQDTARDGRVPEKRGAVGISASLSNRPEDIRWCVILRVDKKSVEIGYRDTDGKHYARKEDIRTIRQHKTAAEVAVEFPYLLSVFDTIAGFKKARAAKKKALAAAADVVP